MAYYGTILCILSIFISNKIVKAQFGSFDIQRFLNGICSSENAPAAGCKTDGVAAPTLTDATVPPFSSTVTLGPNQAYPQCTPNEKICPQLQSKCVPNEIDCNLINSGIKCRIPAAYGVVTQVLLCGDGTPLGQRCGNGKIVPFLTTLLIQCGSNNYIEQRPVSSLGALTSPGADGGAGVYRCSQSGSWEPQSRSPFLTQLTLSCRDADCGKVPHPGKKMPIHRRWAWVRALYKDDKLHCTATLVSSTAAVTAAHCLWSDEINQREPDLLKFQLEIPGPTATSPRIKVHPENVYIHPRYDHWNLKNDLAIMFFKMDENYILPTVCITNQPYTSNLGKKQVVASLQKPDVTGAPLWKFSEASWDRSCITVTNRFTGGCNDVLTVDQSQFCATHKDVSITRGSSGGPYLAEIGNELEEVWVLMGVLSKFTNTSSCMKDHSIYGQVADDSMWIKNCIFDKRCT